MAHVVDLTNYALQKQVEVTKDGITDITTHGRADETAKKKCLRNMSNQSQNTETLSSTSQPQLDPCG